MPPRTDTLTPAAPQHLLTLIERPEGSTSHSFSTQSVSAWSVAAKRCAVILPATSRFLRSGSDV